MPTCTLQVRLDTSLRKEADELFTNAGMDLSSAVRLFLRQSVIRRRLPFEVVTQESDVFRSEASRPVLREPDESLELGNGARKLPPWAGTAVSHIRVEPGMKHDMESIRKDIGRGVAAELAERGCLMVAED